MSREDILTYGSDFSRKRTIHRIGLGSLVILIGQGINVFRQILLVPLFLWAWGSQLYGEWLTLYAVVAYLYILDFGMQMYVVNRLNQCYSLKQLKEYTAILHSALLLYVGIAIAAACFITIAAFVVPIERWLNFKLLGHSIAAVVAVLLAIQLIFLIPQGLIIGLYRTFGELPRGAMLVNIQQLAILVLTGLTLIIRGNIVHIAAVQLVPLLAITCFVLYDLKKRHPEIAIGLNKSNWRLAFTYLVPSSLFFLIQVANGFTFQGSIIVVSIFAGSTYVAVFVVHRTLTFLIRQILGSFNSVIWPELTTLEAQGDYNRLRVIHKSFVKLTFAVCVFAGIWLHFAGKDIIELWTLGKITFDQRLLDVLLLYLVFQTPWLASSVFPAAFNKHRNLAVCYILSAVLGVALSIVLVQHMGVVGVAAGLLIADVLICGWFVPLDTCRIIGESFRKYWMEVVVRGLPIIMVLWGIGWFLHQFELQPILSILATGSGLALVGIGLGYSFWLSSIERVQVLSVGTALWNEVVSFNSRRL